MNDLYDLIENYCNLERVRRTRIENALNNYLDGSELKAQIAKTALPKTDKSLSGVDAKLEEAYSAILSEIAFSEIYVLRENEDFVADDSGNITVYTDAVLCHAEGADRELHSMPLCHLFAFAQLSDIKGIRVNEGENSLYFNKTTIRDILNNDYSYHFIYAERELIKFI